MHETFLKSVQVKSQSKENLTESQEVFMSFPLSQTRGFFGINTDFRKDPKWIPYTAMVRNLFKNFIKSFILLDLTLI